MNIHQFRTEITVDCDYEGPMKIEEWEDANEFINGKLKEGFRMVDIRVDSDQGRIEYKLIRVT